MVHHVYRDFVQISNKTSQQISLSLFITGFVNLKGQSKQNGMADSTHIRQSK